MSVSTIAESIGKALPAPLPADRLKFRYAWPDQGIFHAPARQRTHVLILGEVENVFVHRHVTPETRSNGVRGPVM